MIALLESLRVDGTSHDAPLRFPVQLVARHAGHQANDFRGYMGRIEAGKVQRGDILMVQPSGRTACVEDIVTFDGSLASAVVGQSVTLVLDRDLDISRGDMLATAARPATLLTNLTADLCWLSEEPLDLNRKYSLKHTTRHVFARVTHINALLDINTQLKRPADSLKLNDIAEVAINVQQPLAVDAYDIIRATGAFILIDELTKQTVAAGMIRLNS